MTGKSAQPGRVIWNIESGDVQKPISSGSRQQAPSSSKEPYVFQKAEAAAGAPSIATFADPDGNYFQLMSPMQM